MKCLMARLPDRFDLWVRKARENADPARQADYVLGALVALAEWCFLNIGTTEDPQPGETEFGGERHLLVFSDTDRVEEILEGREKVPLITMPGAAALKWCMEQKAGLLVNAGEDAVVISPAHVESYYAEWSQRAARESSRFWIPNMTTEEEDFWQEHGV